MHRRELTVSLSILLAIGGLFAGSAIGATINVPGAHGPTIQAAINAASSGDEILVAAGTYVESLNIYNKSLTLRGVDEATVIIDASSFSDYSIDASGDYHFVFEDFTLYGHPTYTSAYGLKVAGDNATAEIRRVTVANSRRSGIDLNGLNGAVIDDVDVSNVAWGVGVGLTDCSNVALSNITTTNNAWSGMAIYTRGAFATLGSDNIALSGVNVFNEGFFYTEIDNAADPGNPAPITNLSIPLGDSPYLFLNSGQPNHTMYAVNFLAAETAALASPTTISIIDRATGAFVVSNGMMIQPAIDAADPGDAINVGAGTYEEQLHINKDLALTGAGAGLTTILSPVNLVLSWSTSYDYYAVVFVEDAMADLADFTLDGAGRGNANYRFVGLGYNNGGGTVDDCEFLDVRDTPFSGAQHGVAISSWNDDAVARTLAVTDCDIVGFQKNAMALNAAGDTPLDVTVTGNTITGAGPTAVTAQNGVQTYGDLITGLIDGNTITGVAYDGANWVGTSILNFWADVDITNNAIDVAHMGIYNIDGAGTIADNVVEITKYAGYGYGIVASDPPHAPPSPMVDDEMVKKTGRADKATQLVSVVGNEVLFVGPDNTGTYGIEGDAGYGPSDLALVINDNVVTGFDVGIEIYQCESGCDTGVFVSVDARRNDVAGNTLFGVRSNADYLVVDATNCWWGDVTGPSGEGMGTGVPVSPFVDFTPWLSGGATIGATVTGLDPAPCGAVNTVTVNYGRDAATAGVRGYNVTFAVTGGVVFNLASIVEGTAFNGFSSQFYKVDNGDGTYTVSCSILGSTTGLLTGGDLFSVALTADSEGPVVFDIIGVVLRDPDNLPIMATVTGTGFTIDCTASSAVTGITAAPAHNKVIVTWGHNGLDVASYAVFRGLWYDTNPGTSAYPEYDDLAGNVIPTRPANYAAAVASPEWELAGTTPAGIFTFNDDPLPPEVLDRGVYYYEVFAIDAATNGSNAAAANDRATNYWLGDVNGDGLVTAALDIDPLGDSFGECEGDAGYNNVCDVGPTDDWSRVGIPTTDSCVDFEDLIVFAMNFGVVSAAKSLPAIDNTAFLAWTRLDETRYALQLAGGNGLLGVRVQASVAVRSVSAGALLADQHDPYFLRNLGGGLDANLAVMGGGITGTGDLLIIDLAREITADDLTITARGLDNSEIQVSFSEPTGAPLPSVFALDANYPNPFNPQTTIGFALPHEADVRLAVYGIDGRLVRVLVDEHRDAGNHSVIWRGDDAAGRRVATGTYFYIIDADGFHQVRKMSLVK